jgi:hypothetical protein
MLKLNPLLIPEAPRLPPPPLPKYLMVKRSPSCRDCGRTNEGHFRDSGGRPICLPCYCRRLRHGLHGFTVKVLNLKTRQTRTFSINDKHERNFSLAPKRRVQIVKWPRVRVQALLDNISIN